MPIHTVSPPLISAHPRVACYEPGDSNGCTPVSASSVGNNLISGPQETSEFTNQNIWEDWFPEQSLADVLAGNDVVANIGQVKGAWKAALEKEVRAGRLVKWRGHWFPNAGALWGIGPLKTCYGRPEVRDMYATFHVKVAA